MLDSLRQRLRQLTVLLAVAGMIIFNVYVRELPFYSATRQKISPQLATQLIPATYTALIWYAIFTGLIAYATYQLLPRQTRNALHNRLAFWLVLACVAQVVWIYLWDLAIYQWALCALFVLLEAVIVMYRRLEIGRIRVRRNETLFVRLPISLFLGWLTITTLVYSTTFLTLIGWDYLNISPELWAIIAIGLTAILAGIVAQRHHDFIYAAAVIWGFSGIAVANPTSLPISLTVIVLSIAMLLAILASPTAR
ncbi:MAG TPA: hypothetical protein ENJ56_02925 [Anaerolineae bacterium]|nr:hypothetical protein [Anaerolineae bacterium]